MIDLLDWLEEYSEGYLWYVKRLSGNDTLANGAHQGGPYVPRPVFFRLFPSLKNHTHENADTRFNLIIDSHPDIRKVRIVWYNNKLWNNGTRDEVRITNLGGSSSPLLDPDSTGALVVFAFRETPGADTDICHVWICRNDIEEDIVERKIGPVEPGQWTLWPPDADLLRLLEAAVRADCRLAERELPPEWLTGFPTGEEIIRKVTELRPEFSQLAVDDRLLRRRKCEFELFRSLEEATELPRIREGFTTIAGFLATAQTILQRRKSRSGKSLELHMREILIEEGFEENRDFTYQPRAGNNPDFLFPNEAAYADAGFPREQLRMLAVKTTFRDRWRQVTEECADLPVRHLLTLQEGVSETQFRLISEAGIRLVVPEPNVTKYRKTIQPELMTIESFLADVRTAKNSAKTGH